MPDASKTMNVLLVTDDEVTGLEIRKILLRNGLDCPASSFVRTELAAQQLGRTPAELVVVVMPDDPDRAISLLGVLENLSRPEGMRVLAVGPASDPKMVLRALRGIVDDYLDITELSTEMEDALARWRSSRASQVEAGRVITLLAPSGGSGSSTLAANLAALLAQKYKSVVLIDMKLQTGDLAALLDLKPTYTLSDLCQNIARLDRTFFERSLTRHECGVHLLAPPRRFDDVAYITPEGVQQAIELARSAYPYVLVDLDHSFRPEQAEVLRRSQLVLLVLRLDFASLRNARRAIEYMEHLGINRDRIRLVVNRHGQPKEISPARAEEALGMKVFHLVPDDPKAVNRANNNGVPVVLSEPRSYVSKSLAKLASGVNGRPHEQ
jgi:pilus assembly protein CpaE